MLITGLLASVAWPDLAHSQSATSFSDSFESGDMSRSSDGVSWRSGANVAVTSEIAHSGRYSLKFFFKGGEPGTDARAEQRFSLGGKYREVEISWYAYYPDGTEGLGAKYAHRRESPGNNKSLRLWDGDVSDRNDGYSDYYVKVGGSTWAGDALGDSSLGPEYGVDRQGVGKWGLPAADSVISDDIRGRWVQVRYKARVASSADRADGLLELYIDNKPVFRFDGLALASSRQAEPALSFGYLLGYANSGFDKDTYVFIDDVEISARNEVRAEPNPPTAIKVD